MSEREEVGSSTILRIACSRIQRLTLKAWCVAYRENSSARGGEICIYAWQINSHSWRRRREAPMEVRQLNYQRQSRAVEVLQNQGPPHADACTGTCWHHLFVRNRCNEPLKWMTFSFPGAGASLCLQSQRFKNTWRQKCTERPAKQEKCSNQITGSWTIVPFLMFIPLNLCP